MKEPRKAPPAVSTAALLTVSSKKDSASTG